MQSYDDDAEEDVDVVKVFYDDDPAALQPILASLATPEDPFARSIATQVGWNQQIKAVFQDPDSIDDDDTMRVVGPVDFKEQMPINTLTNVCLIAEGVGRLNLSDAKTDGSVCDVLTKATNELRLAVESAQTEFLKITKEKTKGVTDKRKEREEKASGFFLPIWALMDQMKHVSMDAGDVIGLSRRYVNIKDIEIQEAQTNNEKNVLSLLNTEIQKVQTESEMHGLSLLYLTSSNLGFHLVSKHVERSAAFGRMNPWLHTKLLRLFDSYRVMANKPMMMKRIHSKTTANDSIRDVISIKRVGVKVPINIFNWLDLIDKNKPITENDVVALDGIEITLAQHNNTQLKEDAERFKTGTHAAIHLRASNETVKLLPGEADSRGNTLSFLYRWPEIESTLDADDTTLEVDTVKIVLYGSGKVNWWEDYWWEGDEKDPTKHSVMPYPPRRVYIADSKTMIEYHDIMHLIFSETLYGNFGDLPNSIKLVQSMFARYASGATGKSYVMVVLESREIVKPPYPRFDRLSKDKPVKDGKTKGQILRKFPRMRDVLLKTTLPTVWDNRQQTKGRSKSTQKGDPIRGGGLRNRENRERNKVNYERLDTHTVPLLDLGFKHAETEKAFIQDYIRLKLRRDFIGNTLSWISAGEVGLHNLVNNYQNIPDQRRENLLNLPESFLEGDDISLDDLYNNITQIDPIDSSLIVESGTAPSTIPLAEIQQIFFDTANGLGIVIPDNNTKHINMQEINDAKTTLQLEKNEGLTMTKEEEDAFVRSLLADEDSNVMFS